MLGRLVIKDERDKNFPLRALTEKVDQPLPKYKYWNDTGWRGNQNIVGDNPDHPYCVAFGWLHFLHDAPITHPGINKPIIDPLVLYKEAQDNDETPGDNYDGTSVRGGAKAIQIRGHIKEYRWGTSVEDLQKAVSFFGPTVIGINWYESFFKPSPFGVIDIHSDDTVAGGHCVVVNGIDNIQKVVRIKNSWGTSWGSHGHCYISFSDMERLIKEDGEVCLATEVKL